MSLVILCFTPFFIIITTNVWAEATPFQPGASSQAVRDMVAKCDSLLRIGGTSEARLLAESAVKRSSLELGELDLITAEALNVLGSVCWIQQKFDTAGHVWQEALDIRERELPPTSPEVAQCLANVAATCYVQGRFGDATEYYERALSIYRDAYSEHHHTVAVVAANLAAVYSDLSRYSKAESLLREALSIHERELGKGHPTVAAGVRDLGYLYIDQGRWGDAREQLLRALEMQQRAYLPHYADSPEIGRTMAGLGRLAMEEGRYSGAEQSLRKALAIFNNSLGKHHPDIAKTLVNLSSVCANLRRYPEADSLIVLAQATYEGAQHGECRELAACMEQHAIIEFAQNNLTGADSLFQLAINLLDSCLAIDHPQILRCCENYALFLNFTGQHAQSMEFAQQAWTGFRRNLATDGPVLPERMVLQFANSLQTAAADYLSVVLNGKDNYQHAGLECANIIAATKGLVTQIISDRNRLVRSNLKGDIAALNDSLQLARYALARLRQREFSVTNNVSARQFAEAVALKEKYEARLFQAGVDVANVQNLLEVSVEEFTRYIPPQSAVIDYYRYQHRLTPDTSEDRYVAVVWRPETSPKVVELGAADSIDATILWYRSHMENFASQDPNDYELIAGELYSRLWQPVASLIKSARTVFVVPDAQIHHLSFAGLLEPDGSVLVERHAIHYLSAISDLMVSHSGNGSDIPSLISFGDPDFGESIGSGVSQTIARSLLDSNNAQVASPLKQGSVLHNLSRTDWMRLPGAKVESERLIMLWDSLYDNHAVAFAGPEATEERFKSEVGRYSVVHLATHGYFVGTKSSDPSGRSFLERKFYGENPMLQCGLVMAGANLWSAQLSRPSIEDGLLTAEEIVGLDLSGTELVLLSACETAQGDIKAGEGMFGLRRAFLLAGARTVVGALWKVQDQDAAHFMQALLAAGLPVSPEKVRLLELELLHQRRIAGQSTHPYYWAGFIVTGAWQ